MNCQEVIELMHRDLDKDLNSEESERLHEHVQSCSDCAAMHERLKRLSNDLVQLPKVEPPYSIVDSIMPELDRIDQQRQQASQPARSPFERLRRSVSFRMMGGIAASVAFIILVASGSLWGFGQSAPEHAQLASNSSADASSGPEMAPMTTFSGGNEMLNKRALPSESIEVQNQSGYNQYSGDAPSDEKESAGFHVMMDTAGFADQSYPSPDGKYTAFVAKNEHGRFQVEIVDDEGNAVFVSAQMDVDAVVDVQWDEALPQLVYTVYSGEESAQFVIDLADAAADR